MTAALKAKDWHLALSILEQLGSAGVEADLVTFNLALSACEARSLALGRFLGHKV